MSDPLVDLVRPWLEPVSPESPAGAPADAEPLYLEVVAAIEESERDATQPAPYALCFRIASAGRELLRTRSKDLRVAAYVAFADLRLSPEEGFGRGVTLLTELMGRYWDTLFPAIHAAGERVAALAWFVERARRSLEASRVALAVTARSAMDRFEAVVRRRLGDDALTASMRALRALVERPAPAVSLLDELLAEADSRPHDDGYDLVKLYGAAPFLRSIRDQIATRPVDAALVAPKVAEIDAALTAQLNVILHHPAFQRLEAAWRALKHLVDRVDFRENIELAVLQVTKTELFDDLLRGAHHSRLDGLVCREAYESGAARPYGLLVGEYEFGPDDADMAILERIALLAEKAHAPFVAGVSVSMFDLDAWSALPEWLHTRFRAPMRELPFILEGPRHARWQAFRESDEAAYVGLCLPRFLLRPPYGPEGIAVKAFAFEEDVREQSHHYLWGNAAVALAARVADSFAKYRWCPNIIGPVSGGAVEDLPSHRYEVEGEERVQPPVECALTVRGEYMLSESGFIGLTFRKELDHPCFFAANSCREPRRFGTSNEDRIAEAIHRLGGQLPYVFMVSRITHYLHAQAAELLQLGLSVAEVSHRLREWLAPHGAATREPARHGHGRCFLRSFQINGEGQPAGARFDLEMSPSFRSVGVPFTLRSSWTIRTVPRLRG